MHHTKRQFIFLAGALFWSGVLYIIFTTPPQTLLSIMTWTSLASVGLASPFAILESFSKWWRSAIAARQRAVTISQGCLSTLYLFVQRRGTR
jgi:hypothetical protein